MTAHWKKENFIILADATKYMLSRDNKWESWPLTNPVKPFHILLEYV